MCNKKISKQKQKITKKLIKDERWMENQIKNLQTMMEQNNQSLLVSSKFLRQSAKKSELRNSDNKSSNKQQDTVAPIYINNNIGWLQENKSSNSNSNSNSDNEGNKNMDFNRLWLVDNNKINSENNDCSMLKPTNSIHSLNIDMLPYLDFNNNNNNDDMSPMQTLESVSNAATLSDHSSDDTYNDHFLECYHNFSIATVKESNSDNISNHNLQSDLIDLQHSLSFNFDIITYHTMPGNNSINYNPKTYNEMNLPKSNSNSNSNHSLMPLIPPIMPLSELLNPIFHQSKQGCNCQ